MMITMIEVLVLILAIILAIFIYKLFKTLIHLAINAVIGILVLIVANFLLALQIKVTLIPILICAFAGVFGAVAIIILSYFKIAFV
jgi:hypothetical protein